VPLIPRAQNERILALGRRPFLPLRARLQQSGSRAGRFGPALPVGQRVKEPVGLTGREQRRLELSDITTRRILYWLAAMVAVLVAGTIIGLIWADTSNVAGSIAVATNIIGVVGIASLLIALVVKRRRRRS
jgi:hypothetical protein